MLPIDVDIAWESAAVGVDELRSVLPGDAEVRPAYEAELAAPSDGDFSALIWPLSLAEDEGLLCLIEITGSTL